MTIKVGDQEYYEIPELAVVLKIKEKTARHYLNKGIIPGGVRLGKKWVISVENLNKFLSGEKQEK